LNASGCIAFLSVTKLFWTIMILPKKRKDMSDIVCRPVKNEDELRECFLIRKKIFVDEQGLFKETDRDENDEKSIHIVALHKDKVIGTVRVYKEKKCTWWGGRLAVRKKNRGRAGKLLIQKAVEIVKEKNAKHFRANVQLENVRLLKGLGWEPTGDVFLYNGKPHQLMESDLK
jgi:putative N-acetyltransferase (TIGR04045 family)